MDELKTLLRRKATNIVFLSSETDESASGHVETTTKTYACKINGQPFELETSRTVNFLKHNAGGGSITSEKQITEERYNQLTAGKPPLDTPEALAKIARTDELREKKSSLVPKCPNCSSVMKEQNGTRGEFWSCPHYPRCKGSLPMSGEYKLVRNELFNL